MADYAIKQITIGSNTYRFKDYYLADWARAASKPSYNFSEIATGNAEITSQNYFRLNDYVSSVCHFFTNVTPVQTVIYTKIKYLTSAHMPLVRIYGYAYGLTSPIELKIGFYIYGGDLGWCGAVSMGAWRPEIRLFKYTQDSVDYVAIGFIGACYYLGFDVDYQLANTGTIGTTVLNTGWTTDYRTQEQVSASNTIIPDVGTNNCVSVDYKSTLASLGLYINGAWNYYDGSSGKYIDLDSVYINTSTLNAKTYLKSDTDNRSTNTTPNDYNGKLNVAGLKNNTTIGIASTEGTYSGVLGIRGWSDSSGGKAHEFAFTENGNIYHRSGSTTTWGSWGKLAKVDSETFNGATTFNGGDEDTPVNIAYNIDNTYGMCVNVTNSENESYTHYIDFNGTNGGSYSVNFPAENGTLALEDKVASTIAISNGYIQLKNSNGTVISQVQLPTYDGSVS